MEQHINGLKAMNIDELTAKFGRCIHDKELAKYFGMDVRTLRKSADQLHGIRINRKYYFFEEHLERMINAKSNNQERKETLQSKLTSTGEKKQKNTKTVSRRQQKIMEGRYPLGEDNKRNVRESDRHNLRKFI